jgi:CRISPR-associated protein Cas2
MPREFKMTSHIQTPVPVQNSVFEGEVTKAHLERIKAGLRKIISDDKDSVIFYRFTNSKWIKRETMGIEKSPATNLL